MTMKHFTRIPVPPVATLKALMELDEKPWLWEQITARQDFPGSDHKDTETIYLRGPGLMQHPIDYMRVGNAVPYHRNMAELPEVINVVHEALNAVGAKPGPDMLGYGMVVKLKPGGHVTPHIDEGPYADHFTRFHLVLSTNPGCVMRSGEQWQHMGCGELWQFDHKAEHEFVNEGDTDRIHIIFDCVPRPDLGVCVTGRTPATLPPMFEIRHSSVDEMLANSTQLFSQHWEEIARNKDVMVLKPDEAAYRTMEDAGRLMILAAVKAGQIVGYSVNFIVQHPHYADLTVCQNDLLFIEPTHRQGGAGIRLMRRTEEEGKARGARLMLWHAKEGTPLADILPRMSYSVQDIIFSKEL